MLATLFVILTFSALYWFAVRRWMSRWGANQSDLARVMAGDALLVNPTYLGTMAVIIDAAPEHVWPWLVRIGYRRGGLYSYDWLERLFGFLDRPSAIRILRNSRTWPLVIGFPWAKAQAGRSSRQHRRGPPDSCGTPVRPLLELAVPPRGMER